MLHMVVMSHTPESCPGRPGNEEAVACVQKIHDLAGSKNVQITGSWADPPAHVNFLLLAAPDAHAVQALLMESGVTAWTSTTIHAVVSAI